MKYLSVCSGIEAASCAWHPLGWTPVAFSEIEKFPSAVLAHHYPGVPNWGDMTKFKEWPDADVDVLVGGTPCQSFSVAGLRKGLADPRGNLALTYLALADRYRPEWLVWENVPGVLSADKGEAFGAFLGGLGELGYGWAYRVLDAQYFGLAQRRKRVFVVASLGSWQRAAAVLFDAASLRGDSAPSREAGQRPAASLRTRPPGSGGQGTDWEHTVAHALAARAGSALCAPDIQTYLPTMLGQVAPCLDAMMDKKWGSNQWVDSGQFVMCASDGQAGASVLDDQAPCLTGINEQPYVAHTLRGDGFDASEDGGNDHADSYNVVGGQAIAFDWKNSAGAPNSEETFGTPCKEREMAVLSAMQVRRLTPRECERLQGFPDDYTLTPYRGKPAADGPRYKALGNSMAVPVMHWIGRRIQQVADIQEQEATA